MHKHLLATAALLPTLALSAVVLPAQADTTGQASPVQAQSVNYSTSPDAAPLHALRSYTQTCSGTLVSKQTLVRSGKVYGVLDIYSKTGNGGTAIACFRHAGVTAHKRLVTTVVLRAWKVRTSHFPAVVVRADGHFISYAGPVAVGGVKGHCVDAIGGIAPYGAQITVTSPVICFK